MQIIRLAVACLKGVKRRGHALPALRREGRGRGAARRGRCILRGERGKRGIRCVRLQGGGGFRGALVAGHAACAAAARRGIGGVLRSGRRRLRSGRRRIHPLKGIGGLLHRFTLADHLPADRPGNAGGRIRAHLGKIALRGRGKAGIGRLGRRIGVGRGVHIHDPIILLRGLGGLLSAKGRRPGKIRRIGGELQTIRSRCGARGGAGSAPGGIVRRGGALGCVGRILFLRIGQGHAGARRVHGGIVIRREGILLPGVHFIGAACRLAGILVKKIAQSLALP